MKFTIAALAVLALCAACKTVPDAGTGEASSTQSGISVYGVIDAGVTSTR